MTKSPVVVERSTSMTRALHIMAEHGFHHLPVMASGQLVGVVSEQELKALDSMQGFPTAMCTVGDFILHPPYAVPPSASLHDVARSMAENRYGSAVVIEGDKVIGIFTLTNALRALAAVLES